MPQNICLTGRLKVGKDYVAATIGATIVGFADPIYEVAKHFFGTADKDLPGMREFMQRAGQWGRGDVSPEYPFTPERALFIGWMRGAMPKILPHLGVDWPRYGLHQDLWVDSLLTRVKARIKTLAHTGCIAVSNVRFENELKPLAAAGFTHYHVMCSPATYLQRLKAAGMDPKSPQLRDKSEQLAHALDRRMMDEVNRRRVGPKLRVVWNDPAVLAPSKRLLTLAEFKTAVLGDSQTAEKSVAVEPAPAKKIHNVPGRLSMSDAAAVDRTTEMEVADIEDEINQQDAAIKRFVEEGQ